jgi:hypothetical protein
MGRSVRGFLIDDIHYLLDRVDLPRFTRQFTVSSRSSRTSTRTPAWPVPCRSVDAREIGARLSPMHFTLGYIEGALIRVIEHVVDADIPAGQAESTVFIGAFVVTEGAWEADALPTELRPREAKA